MIEFILKKQIEKLTKEDIIEFAKKNGVTLKHQELETIYNHIKKDWKELIFGNPEPIFEKAKQNLQEETYQKVRILYQEYKEKYQAYL